MPVQALGQSVGGSLQLVWDVFLATIPNLVVSLLVFVFGLMVAAILGGFVEKVFEAAKFDAFLKTLGLEPYFDRAGMRLRGSRFMGQLVNWFLVIAFLLAASDILKLGSVSLFLNNVLNYIPNIAVAVVIMLTAVVIANFLRRIVTASVMSARLHAANFLGSLTWWAIIVFGLLTALVQLNVAVSIINTLVTGFIAMVALAGGLAFGLGGKEYAAHLLGKLREQTESHR
jgi:hypothetical protein